MPRARAASSSSPLAYPLSRACSRRQAAPGQRGVHRPVISTSVTGPGGLGAAVRFGAGRWPAASGCAGLGDVHLVPVQPLRVFRRTARPGHTARPGGIWPAGAPAHPPPDHLLPPSRQNCWIQIAAAPGPRAGRPASPARRVVDLPQQVVARPGRTARPGRALGLCRPAAGRHRSAARRPLPGRVDRAGQPARRGGGQPFQRRPHGLPASSSRSGPDPPRTWVESVRCRIPAPTRPSSPSRRSALAAPSPSRRRPAGPDSLAR